MFNRANRARNPRGFTLVELLVVISIIAILMGFLVPTLKSVRRKTQEARTLALIQAVGMSCDAYRLTDSTYPPDRVPTAPILDKTAEAVVWALSGSSICYAPGVSRADYPWRNTLYVDSTPLGTGRRSLTAFMSFKSANLMDKDGDLAPELVDSWGKRFVYNSGGDANWSDASPNPWNQLGAPKHTKGKFDFFSAGYDGKYGPYPYPNGENDDLRSWGDEAAPPVDYDYPSMNSTEP